MRVQTRQALALAIVSVFSGLAARGQSLPNLFPFPNAAGWVETYNTANRPIDLGGPFFQSLGTNGRSCASCHQPAQGWAISAEEVKARFELTRGLDPIFRTNDGSNCDHNIDTSTLQGRRKAYSMLTNKGLIRIALLGFGEIHPAVVFIFPAAMAELADDGRGKSLLFECRQVGTGDTKRPVK